MTPDSELLHRYTQTGSESAFAELVQRHLNLVYSAALRQVGGDAHLAQDVAQTVFTDLARKADSLSRRETLTGWLYTGAHFAAAKIARTESRRREREEKFMREPTHETAPEADWEKIRPALDAAMHELKKTDREAVLLRYFENRQFAEVGAKLGLNENAARMRVERALEKLRGIFAKRGITTATAFASLISANAVQIAPANLAAALATTSIATTGTGTFTLLKIMTATKLKLAFSALVVAGAATAFLYQEQSQSKLRVENGSLRQQIAQLKSDNDRVAPVSDSKLADEQFKELLRLRGEVGMLRQKVAESKKAQDEIKQADKKAQVAEQTLAEVLSAHAKFVANESRTINAMKTLGLDMRIYSSDHRGRYPTNNDLYEWVREFSSNTNLLRGIPYIEYTNAGSKLNSRGQPEYPNMVVFRERIVRQAPNGTWHRIYGLADGSVQTATSYNGNFDAWEKANTYSPPPSQ